MSTLPPFEYASAETKEQALASIGPTWDDSVIYAGGIDLLDLMKERLHEPRRLINIKAVPELKFVTANAEGTTEIGPLVTLAEIASHPDLSSAFPALARACGKAATPQIRNVATLGGNLCQRPRCWYFRSEEYSCLKKGGDKCFAREGENKYHSIFTAGEPCVFVHPSAAAVGLLALEASVRIASASGQERTVPMARFFVPPRESLQRENVLKPDELITAVIIPAEARHLRQAYLKQREKQSFDWPLADCAAAARFDGEVVKDIRIALGAAAPVPLRAQAAEKFLLGKPLNVENAARAGELSMEGARPLTGNGYKTQLFPVIVRRTLAALVERKRES